MGTALRDPTDERFYFSSALPKQSKRYKLKLSRPLGRPEFMPRLIAPNVPFSNLRQGYLR